MSENNSFMEQLRILLIEDDEDDYLITRRLLSTIYAERMTLDWAQTYEAGLALLKPCQHDVCLLDYRLGARNGIELLRAICAESFQIPIILMTGQGDREIDIEATRVGAADYLLKGQTDAALLERAIRYSIQHKQSEAARRQLREEREARALAEEANRARDAFLAMVTHELRSPLNAILGWAQILLRQPADEAMTRHALEAIEQSARTQSHLIEDLLDTARITSGKLRLEVRPVVLDQVIAAALAVVSPAAEAKNIAVQVSVDEHINVISGDPARLQQIIWNLLSNAIKFTPAGGRVSVTLERADPHARITVSDSGKGISPEFLPRLFEQFSQEPDQTQGTRRKSGLGLGLALARHLTELHGGTIEAASAGRGQGATFTLNFPLRAVRPKSAARPQTDETLRARAGLLSGLRVLVVDDEDDARELVATVLQQSGAQAQSAASATEALELLQTGGRFALLVSDIGMPERNGYDLIEAVRALAPEQGGDIPAIALTAYGRSEDRQNALSAGFQAHIPKPVEPTELVHVAANLTGRSASGQELSAATGSEQM